MTRQPRRRPVTAASRPVAPRSPEALPGSPLRRAAAGLLVVLGGLAAAGCYALGVVLGADEGGAGPWGPLAAGVVVTGLVAGGWALLLPRYRWSALPVTAVSVALWFVVGWVIIGGS
ncbi:MAG: hypothetical protein GXX79_05930 [Actinomycetales bacterium]|nr:hypothetical protein [Actinomycetales bacterium]